MSLKEKLTVSASPHVRSPETTTGIMLDVIISLIPALAASVWLFGLRTLLVTATTVLSCMLSEFFSRKIMKRQGTLGDLSAIVTGILLAFNLPATIPLWVAAIGSVVAIVVVKQFFGGIGQNFVNPALVGRIVLMASFPTMMSTWVQPFAWRGVQVVTTASPLASISSMFTAGDVSAAATASNPALPSLVSRIPELDMSFCENRAADSVVGYYCALAKREGIPFCAKLDLPQTLPVDEIDMCLVLSNLLENAFEASLRTAPARRKIEVTAYVHAARLVLIEAENAFDGEINENSGVFRSSKRKGNGIGIQSVRHIAEKSGGASTVTYQDGLFCAKVMLRG